MRITEHSRFAHPVLAPNSGDFASGAFDLTIVADEKPTTGALSIEHEVLLTEPSIRQLVESGKAAVGIFVRCDDTYYRELRRVSWPRGRTDFLPGTLLNRVIMRPLIWLEEDLGAWNPEGVHREFEPPMSLRSADVIAVGTEYILSVGQSKLAALESIFELSLSAEPIEGIRVDPDADRIQIMVGPGLFQTISLLREQQSGLSVLLNGVYLPAVMEVLDLIRTGAADFSERRWHQAFTAKCDAKGINPSDPQSLIESAQHLLEHPCKQLSQLLADVGGEG